MTSLPVPSQDRSKAAFDPFPVSCLTLGTFPHPVLQGTVVITSDLHVKDSANLLNMSYPQRFPCEICHYKWTLSICLPRSQQRGYLAGPAGNMPLLNTISKCCFGKRRKKAKRKKAYYSKEPNWWKIQIHCNMEAAIAVFETWEGSVWSGNIYSQCDFIFMYKDKNIHICI